MEMQRYFLRIVIGNQALLILLLSLPSLPFIFDALTLAREVLGRLLHAHQGTPTPTPFCLAISVTDEHLLMTVWRRRWEIEAMLQTSYEDGSGLQTHAEYRRRSAA
ncbi:hypothetical protein BJ878DRAFT_500606 [Calycina marina]|uniref:Uncharacterized protein n=1 Tax=Calycina marina TaxID=1763456 RepID=A0A9P7Z4V2_9HELO|nr:hypothetical protein BJ878DRAFT_500606 [Calycina marina]